VYSRVLAQLVHDRWRIGRSLGLGSIMNPSSTTCMG
jgi:hypothetical protein